MISGVTQRTCVGCRATADVSQLVRFVLDSGGRVVVSDYSNGRGAWLCRGSLARCGDLANKRKAWTRAFRTVVADQELPHL